MRYIWKIKGFMAMCIELATQKGWRHLRFSRVLFHSFCDISAKQKGIVKYYGSFES